MSSRTPNSYMIHCLINGDAVSVRSLLNDDCDPRNVLDCFGNTALHIAAENGDCNIVELLVAKGADVTATNIHGETALISAINAGNLDVCKILLEAGSQVDSREICNIWGLTPLTYAVRKNRVDILSCILDKCNCVNQTNKGGQTALFEACSLGHSACAEILLKAGARTDIKDTHRQTPLLLAIRRGNFECVKVLLQHGCDPTEIGCSIISRCWRLMSPMFAALLSGRLDIVYILWSAMACTEAKLYSYSKDAVILESLQLQDSSMKDWLATCSSSPRSLMDLCLRVISFRVGFKPDRYSRLKSLGIPIAMENRLMLLDM